MVLSVFSFSTWVCVFMHPLGGRFDQKESPLQGLTFSSWAIQTLATPKEIALGVPRHPT